MHSPDGYRLSAETADMDVIAIHGYLSRCYWSPGIPLEVVSAAVKNSLCFGVFEANGAQVAFTRVVTDHATFAYICDVYVLEEHRGKGLAQWMMAAACAHPALAKARRVMLATRDAHGLYRKYGFGAPPSDGVLMQVLRPDIYRRNAAAAV
jgi:ribosomal protein S18 acetylase RimI-like enzyme